MNIHLLTVNTEYFLTRGLKSDRYSAKDSWAHKQRMSPRMSPTLSLDAVALDKMRMMAPENPSNTPPTFFAVSGSFSISADRSMAKIGIDVVTMLALMGEVILSPMVNPHWLSVKPNRPARPSRKTSFTGTCSRFTNSDVIQKRIAAPATRNVTMSIPVTPWVMASLPNGAISPQKAQAKNMLK